MNSIEFQFPAKFYSFLKYDSFFSSSDSISLINIWQDHSQEIFFFLEAFDIGSSKSSRPSPEPTTCYSFDYPIRPRIFHLIGSPENFLPHNEFNETEKWISHLCETAVIRFLNGFSKNFFTLSPCL